MNRREFLMTTAGMALVGVRGAVAAAARYDLVLKGGHVVDPASGLNAVRDVAIADGKIAAVAATIDAGAAQTVDAAGKYVIPGMIDIHSHAGDTKGGPALNIADGVTGYVDAGSRGADKIDDLVAEVKAGPQQGGLACCPEASCRTSPMPMSHWRAPPSPGTAMSSSASRRGFPRTSRETTTSRRCVAPRKSPRPLVFPS